jgi:mevalonate kinase
VIAKQLKARSPAKLILSGEHAVVYGKPAIAMAIDRYATSTVISSLSSMILFSCLNLKYAKSFTRQTLQTLKQQLQAQYHAFLAGNCGIREVLKKPLELMQFTAMHLLESFNVTLPAGVEIRSASQIPVGCGMGSSAAIVMSTLYALAQFLKLDLDPFRFISLGVAAENLQHGYSSGLDLQLAMHGGCLRFDNGQVSKRPVPKFPLKIVNTGTPQVTTGECVTAVSKHFKTSSIGEDFASIAESFDQALLSNNSLQLQECIRINHQLLVKIGVVPLRVQQFIADLEAMGAAAKICGAGAVVGEQAGVVLVASDCDVAPIVSQYGYTMQSVQGDLNGTCIV